MTLGGRELREHFKLTIRSSLAELFEPCHCGAIAVHLTPDGS